MAVVITSVLVGGLGVCYEPGWECSAQCETCWYIRSICVALLIAAAASPWCIPGGGGGGEEGCCGRDREICRWTDHTARVVAAGLLAVGIHLSCWFSYLDWVLLDFNR